ncbi:hypothetical protein LCI18_008931 [Fusarium solani-melongenae]|uniref:Uncharacterized protein n=1 Tax=Fusarium solani subsp. cucurbitae TaxID=2747967 RepID=A0ACD3ZA44_FUSSC|nr:hypothetical protein LCI18_008931 [Fusarium solani-melongenae]
MPPSGRSNFLAGSHCDSLQHHSMSVQTVESELTAPEKVTATNPRIKYPSAKFHDKWPGSGLRHDDPYFANYCAGLTTLCLRKVERQCLGQNALQGLLKHTGKAFLIGEGTGGMMAWLATDVEPDLVAGVIAIEPVGPPFGTTTRTAASGHRIFTQNVRRVEGVRIYGLTDIPLTFDPPANFHAGVSAPDQALPLDVEERLRPDSKGICYLQRNLHEDEVILNHETGKHEISNRVRYRELYNLKKVPQAVVTAHASPHVMYDWMTVSFMVQAGVPVQWIKLDKHQIFGNGHLMFLETNSDDIARLLTEWIFNMTPETFRGSLPCLVAPPHSRQVHGPPREPVEQATAHLPSVDLMDGVEPAHHNDQSLGTQPEHVNPAQPGHFEPSQHGVQLPSVETGHAESVQLEHANTRVDSAQSEDANAAHQNHQSVGLQEDHTDLVPFEHAGTCVDSAQVEQLGITHHNDQAPGLQEGHVGPAQTRHEELPQNDQSPGSENDVDLVPFEYPKTPHNSAQTSSDQSYEPSSSSGPSGDSSGSHHSDQSSGSHHDNQPAGFRQDNHSPNTHRDNRSSGSQGNVGNPGQSEPTSEISYINSSPSQSDDEIVISQPAVTPQNSTRSSLGYSQGPYSSSAHEQPTNKRPAPSSSGRRSLASDPGSSPPATSWGPTRKRPRITTSPLGPNYTPSAANATPGGSWYTDDSPQWNRDQSVESPITSLAMLRPAHPAGPVQLRPRVVTTLSSPVIVSPPPVGYTPHKEFVRAYGLVDLSPAQEQPHSAARDARGHSPRDQSTQGRSGQVDSPQGYTDQGHSSQGYRTQDQSTQGRHPQSYSTEGYSTQANSTQGRSAHDHTAQGSSAHGYTTQIYPHCTARFECQPGTAEESIAAMARVNKARLVSNASRSAAAAEDVHFSPFKQPRILPGSQMSQLNGTNSIEEAPQATIPAPAALPIPERPRTPEAPDSEAEDNWFSMFGCPPRATPPSPSPAPRGSSNPASSNVSLSTPTRAGSNIVTLGTPIHEGSSKRHASK